MENVQSKLLTQKCTTISPSDSKDDWIGLSKKNETAHYALLNCKIYKLLYINTRDSSENGSVCIILYTITVRRLRLGSK